MSCVYCNSPNDLNTELTINVDGEKISVKICDQHSEEATVKSAKAAYEKKKIEIERFLEQAKSLGLDITINSGKSNLSVAKSAAVVDNISEPVRAEVEVYSDLDLGSDDVIDTDLIDSRSMVSIGGSTDYGSVDSYKSFDRNALSDKLSPKLLKGKAKIAIAEGRGGKPLAIQEVRTDGTGTTRIKIDKKENDTRLQERFKKMANNSIDGRAPDFISKGYQDTMRTCPLCRGESHISDGSKTIPCPKCNGSGIFSVY